MTEDFKQKARAEILRLEQIVEQQRAELAEKNQQLQGQSIELVSLGNAAIEVRQEDTEQLADYQKTNSGLITFVDKVAKSKSKYAKEARRVLGYES